MDSSKTYGWSSDTKLVFEADGNSGGSVTGDETTGSYRRRVMRNAEDEAEQIQRLITETKEKTRNLVENSNDDIPGSIAEVKRRIDQLRSLVDRDKEEGKPEEPAAHHAIIDSNILSVVFGVALVVIFSVAVFAFQSLYAAILKKWNVNELRSAQK
jgi:Fe2+ transport system protein B